MTPAIAKTHRAVTVKLSQLHVSPLNVRKYDAKDVDSLAHTIAQRGLIQSLLIRSDGDGYEVHAGQRRLLALRKLAKRDGSDPDVHCIALDTADDAEAIEASLIENTERREMDPIDQYNAIATLLKSGRTETQIADSLGITPVSVKRRLALARLLPAIHKLYREDAVTADALQHLTLATKQQQKAYVDAVKAGKAPQDWQLRAWILGASSRLTTAVALFPLEAYTGHIVTDLFGETSHFADADQFWTLQNQAIAAISDDLIAKGWGDVMIFAPDETYEAWKYTDSRKADGGTVHIVVDKDGSVEVFKGRVLTREAHRIKGRRGASAACAVSDGEDGSELIASARPELSAALSNYADCVRLSAVRAGLVGSPRVALRLLAAHLIHSRTSNLTAVAPAMPCASEGIADSVQGLATEAVLVDASAEALRRLGMSDDAPALVGSPEGEDGVATLFAALLGIKEDKTVIGILAVVMAETLGLGTSIVDVVGTHLGTEVTKTWTPDDVFFDGLRDRAVLSAVLAEVAGTEVARANTATSGKEKKARIRAELAKPGRDAWCPPWLAFPQRTYDATRPVTTVRRDKA